MEYRRTIADSEAAWHEAKEQDDYQLFKPHLISVIEKQKEILSYVTDKKSDYDFMLDSYQINTDIAYYDRFFDAIRKKLLPFLQKLLKREHRLTIPCCLQPLISRNRRPLCRSSWTI